MIRLSALQTFVQEARGWCCKTLPLLVGFRLCISKELPYYYLALFWIGWQILILKATSNSNSNEIVINDIGGSEFTVLVETKQSICNAAHLESHEVHTDKPSFSQQKEYQAPKHCLLFPTSPNTDANNRRRHNPTDSFLFPTDVWVQNICSFLHPRDLTNLACVNSVANYWADHNDVWKHLWMRDYGRALLEWKISRHVLEKSLNQLDSTRNNDNSTGVVALEGRLSNWFDAQASATVTATNMTSNTNTNKCFYFVFGEVYTNYLLAGYNTNMDECFVGLHSHIFDFGSFSEYHPGMIEPILLQCGRDATNFFETIPHSRVARDLARRLCVLANQSCIGSTPNPHAFGLVSTRDNQHDDKDLIRVLKSSNTRPLRLNRPNYLLPNMTCTSTRRPPTLFSIRQEWDEAIGTETRRLGEEQSLQLLKNPLAAWRNRSSPSVWRVYYDPFVSSWKKWDADPPPRLVRSNR